MRFTHLAEQLYHRPWFITPAAHASIRHVFERVISTRSESLSSQLSALDLSSLIPQRRPLAIDEKTGVASIHVLGPIGKNLSQIEQSCGATGLEQIRADYAAALAGGARGVLLDVDSPGGTVTGTPELAAMIADHPLPTVAYTEDMMASAAYYLAAGAEAIVATPSASVGSIGVYIPWMDTSAQYAAAGIVADPIVNTGGDLKALGFGGSLTEEQRAYLQAEVDADFAAFKAHVTNRRAIPDSAMRGQCLSGKSALDANLIDALGDRTVALARLQSLFD